MATQNKNKTCLFRLLCVQEFPHFPKRNLGRTFDGVTVNPRRDGGESLYNYFLIKKKDKAQIK